MAGEYTKPVTEDVKPMQARHACPHCGKMMSFPPAAPSGMGPSKTDSKSAATKDTAKRQALMGKVKKGLHAAFPKDTNASDQVPDAGQE